MLHRLNNLESEARWGLGILIIVILLGIAIPRLSPYNPLTSAGDTFLPPTMAHPFGTDQLGRDVFTRTFAAVQLDIALAFIGVSVPLLIGTLIGGMLGTTP